MADSLGSVQAKRDALCKVRIVDLEFKISNLSLLGKAYYELAQIKIKRNRNLIKQARTQNKLLHATLDTLREKDRIARKNAGDLINLRKTVFSLRVTFDHQLHLGIKRQFQLEAQVTKTHSSELNCAHVLDPNTPPQKKIRVLETRLCMVELKTKDVQTLLRHYTTALKPMKEEYFTYGAKLAAAQEILELKNTECERLIQTNHDAVRARDAAKQELEEVAARESLSKRNEGDLIVRTIKGMPLILQSMINKELETKILKAIKEIKEAMDVGSMREMYHQFVLQEKQSTYLEQIYEELKGNLDDLGYKRKRSTLTPQQTTALHEGSKSVLRRHSSRRGSIPLIRMLEGTKRLVDKLHEGNLTLMEADSVERQVLNLCEERMVKIFQALNRKLRRVQKESEKKRLQDEMATKSQTEGEPDTARETQDVE